MIPIPQTGFEHKRGDTFSFAAAIPSEFSDGYFVGSIVRSQIRDSKGTLITELEVTWDDPALTRALLLSSGNANTQTWPIGPLQFDLQFVMPSGQIRSTKTVVFACVADITHD